LWEYYERAQGILKATQDQKAELKQALSDLVHANRQSALANERLAVLRNIAEEAQKAKATFVAKVSHELRTPLNMIIGLIDLLVETPEVYGRKLPPELLEDLDIVRRNCDHLSSMVNDVLALSQAETERLALHKERVDLAVIVQDACAVVYSLVEKKKLCLQVEIPNDLPKVYCDKTRIRQVILNLASNAARFTEQGGITIRVVERNQQIVVSVEDTGSGIVPQDLERIFEPFCQGTSNLWQDKGGTGLGLSISKQFVELHGGRIWVESEPGVGTTFSFTLPVSPPIVPDAGPERWIQEDWIWTERTSRARFPDSHYKPRVVVCDESGDLCAAFAHCTDKVEWVATSDWAQATRALHQSPAHAVVINAPSPTTLWPSIERARAEIHDTPIIGCSMPPCLQRARQAGAIGYLIKPVKRSDLEGVIQRVSRPVQHVLIVDDDPDVLRLWKRMLNVYDGGLQVTTALTGNGGLQELHTRSPDLMLLDIVLPDMNGWEVMALRNEYESIRDIPVILVSAQDPIKEPAASRVLAATMGEGVSLNKLLRGSLTLSTLFLQPD
jgi:signal transduction histidine kinase/CheY-like chemotaxis protein